MSWADRLLRLASGDPKREIAEQLAAMHRRSVDQAHRFTADAAQAPTAAAEKELRALAADRGAQMAALARALEERGAAGEPSAAPGPVPNGAARNHWARLVAALEACRQERGQILRVTPRLLELDPALAGLLDTVLRGLDAELHALRAMIARADPQALN
jgi:hypothetical protein